MATVLIQCRRGTESEWAASNPILAAGEFGYTSDTGKTKIGNGASQWSALPYATTDLATLATQAALDSLQSQLTDVIGNAPAALDTIHELADALADNADVLSLYATQANLDATDALVALNATQVSLDATDALVALNTTQVAHDADKASLDADIATKADTDDPTFTTGITTPKIDVQSNGTIQGKDIVGNDSLRLRTINNADLTIEPHGTGTVEVTKDVKVTGKVTASGLEMTSSSTIQGKDIVGNNTLKLRTIGNSDLSIEPAGTGIVQISTDVNLATGKEFKVNGVAIGGSSGFTASSTDTLTNKSGDISQWTNDSGYTTFAPTWESKSANFAAAAGTSYFVDTSGGVVTATLPNDAASTLGDEVRIVDATGDFDTNNLTVDPDGGKIQGLAADMINSTERAAFALVYYNATQGWLLKDK